MRVNMKLIATLKERRSALQENKQKESGKLVVFEGEKEREHGCL